MTWCTDSGVFHESRFLKVFQGLCVCLSPLLRSVTFFEILSKLKWDLDGCSLSIKYISRYPYRIKLWPGDGFSGFSCGSGETYRFCIHYGLKSEVFYRSWPFFVLSKGPFLPNLIFLSIVFALTVIQPFSLLSTDTVPSNPSVLFRSALRTKGDLRTLNHDGLWGDTSLASGKSVFTDISVNDLVAFLQTGFKGLHIYAPVWEALSLCSKSIFDTLGERLEDYPYKAYRFFMLKPAIP